MVEGGDLKELIREMRSNRRKFTEKRVWMILESMAAALGYMHSQRILHRDLKSGNVLLGRDARYVRTKPHLSNRENSKIYCDILCFQIIILKKYCASYLT